MNPNIPDEALEFFKKLEKNNDRDWFNEHKKEFKIIEKKVKEVYNTVLDAIKIA